MRDSLGVTISVAVATLNPYGLDPTRTRVLVTDPIADVGLDRLRETGYEVETAYDVEGDALLEAVPDANGLTIRSGTQVTAEAFKAAPNLVIVGRAGIGVNNIDIDAMTRHSVTVANAPEGNIRAAVRHTVATGFAAARSIPQARARLKDSEWVKSDYLDSRVNGEILGAADLGRVDQEAAKKFLSPGMDIIACGPHIGEERVDQLGAELVEFDACLPRADFLTVHTPSTPETEGFISTDEFETMGNGYLTNCAYGGVIGKVALAEAVDVGIIDGAAVDMFADEPVPPDNPLLSVDGVVVTLYLGASTSAAQENVAVPTADQIVAALHDESVINALNAPSVDESAFPCTQPYVGLAETAGKIVAQLLDGRLSEIEVTYTGNIAAEGVKFVTVSAPKGAFTLLEWQINAANVPQVAEERGIEVIESRSRQSDDFQSLVTVTVRNGDEEMTVSGTLFTDKDLRIVRINGYRLDAIPCDQMLVARSYNKSGVISFIGIILGENDVNIAGMFNVRRAKVDGEVLTVYNLDDDMPESIHEEFLADTHIINVNLIML